MYSHSKWSMNAIFRHEEQFLYLSCFQLHVRNEFTSFQLAPFRWESEGMPSITYSGKVREKWWTAVIPGLLWWHVDERFSHARCASVMELLEFGDQDFLKNNVGIQHVRCMYFTWFHFMIEKHEIKFSPSRITGRVNENYYKSKSSPRCISNLISLSDVKSDVSKYSDGVIWTKSKIDTTWKSRFCPTEMVQIAWDAYSSS